MTQTIARSKVDLPSATSPGIHRRARCTWRLKIPTPRLIFRIHTFKVTATSPRWQWIITTLRLNGDVFNLRKVCKRHTRFRDKRNAKHIYTFFTSLWMALIGILHLLYLFTKMCFSVMPCHVMFCRAIPFKFIKYLSTFIYLCWFSYTLFSM